MPRLARGLGMNHGFPGAFALPLKTRLRVAHTLAIRLALGMESNGSRSQQVEEISGWMKLVAGTRKAYFRPKTGGAGS